MKFKALFYQNPAGFIAALLLLILSIPAFFIDKQGFVALLIAFFCVLVIDIIYSIFALKTTEKNVTELSKALVSDDSKIVDDFPLPSVLCDEYGNIVWYNQQFFDDIIDSYDVKELSLRDFFDNFSFDYFSYQKIVTAQFEDRQYTAFVVNVNNSANPMLCFYFLDDTELKEIASEYDFSRPFVMLMLVDNIEQMARQFTDSRFALALSGIESRIEEWLKDEKVLLKKIGNGSFLVIGEKRNLDSLSYNKFKILETIRNLKYKDEPLNATLSIGVGTGENFTECEVRAKKSLDMALGRGGDQAAVYTTDGYIYFGGVANRVNDNSRVSPRQKAANIANLIKKYPKILFMGHKYSDYDAIGAAIGMQFFSSCCGVEGQVVVDNRTTLSAPLIDFMMKNGYDKFISPARAVDVCDENTALIIVDTHREILLDEPELYKNCGACVVIDHHRLCDDYIQDSDVFYCLPSPSSACEMVAELIEYSTEQEKLPSNIATALLSGMVLDTKNFVLRTSQRTFEAAGFLRDNGANTVEVKKLFSIDPEMATIKHEIITSGSLYNNFMIGSTTSDSKNIRVITSSAADDMLSIEGVRGSFVISKLALNKYQISARSLGEENVQLIMEQLKGGGHSTMAAAQVKANSIDEAKEMLLKAIDAYLDNK